LSIEHFIGALFLLIHYLSSVSNSTGLKMENMEFVYFHIKIEKPKLGVEKWKDFGILICHSFDNSLSVCHFSSWEKMALYIICIIIHPTQFIVFWGHSSKSPPALQNILQEMLMILQQ